MSSELYGKLQGTIRFCFVDHTHVLETIGPFERIKLERQVSRVIIV